MLWKLYVLPGHHGQGIGSRLLERRRRRALESEHPRIMLSYLEGNQQAARFYAQHGFVETHRESRDPGLPESVLDGPRAEGRRAGMSGRPDAAAPEAARNLEEMKRMREIEEEILARAPENDIGPSLDRIRAVMELARRPAAHLPRRSTSPAPTARRRRAG